MEFTDHIEIFNTTSFSTIKAKVQSALPLDVGTWDDSRAGEYIDNIVDKISAAIAKLLTGYKRTAQQIVYDEETDEEVYKDVEIDASDFEVEVTWNDNEYYGATIEITVYNNDVVYIDWEHDHLKDWIMDSLNEDSECIKVAIFEAMVDAECEGIISFDE